MKKLCFFWKIFSNTAYTARILLCKRRFLRLTNADKAYIIIGMESIYLDHAATTPLDKAVFEKMAPYFTQMFGNADSPHALGRKAMGAVDLARDTVAQCINAQSNEVYFTGGGTEADNWAVLGVARAKKAEGKTHVIVSAIEHHAVLYAAKTLEEEGFTVTYLPVNDGGRVEMNALQSALTKDTALVAIMAANNETGVLQPIKQAADLSHEYGALFFTDAVQAAPYMPIDVKAWGVDLLSFSSHKFYGPKGCGVLYIKNGVKIHRHVGGGEQERGLRGGTLNVPSIVGFAEAYKRAVDTMQENNAKLQALAKVLEEKLQAVGGVTRNGDKEYVLPAVWNVKIDGVENASLLFNMDLQGVCMAAGSACASASIKPSHVLTAMGLSEEKAKQCVRISMGKNNTQEEIERAMDILRACVTRLRG